MAHTFEAYTFENGPLDKLLDKLIGSSREAIAWRNIRENVPLVKLNHNNALPGLAFEPNGIFSTQEGIQLRVYLYLINYDVQQHKHYPRKHYFRCQTVEKFANFSSTNQEKVDIRCTTTHQMYTNLNLPVCEHCQRIFREQTTQTLLGTSFNDFVLQMACNETRRLPEDLHGYPINFREISTAFRASKNYTCEKCHLQITDYADQRYMHTHHVNYLKHDNCKTNLRCLCIDCHSKVDDRHRNNFKNSLELSRELKAFLSKYPRL